MNFLFIEGSNWKQHFQNDKNLLEIRCQYRSPMGALLSHASNENWLLPLSLFFHSASYPINLQEDTTQRGFLMKSLSWFLGLELDILIEGKLTMISVVLKMITNLKHFKKPGTYVWDEPEVRQSLEHSPSSSPRKKWKFILLLIGYLENERIDDEKWNLKLCGRFVYIVNKFKWMFV